MPTQAERSKFPGMRPTEANVLRAWLRQHEHEYDKFDYNVRVGPGLDPGPEYSEAVRKTAIDSSQKRIDAVGWRGEEPTLIEVKDFAIGLAIAQISEYGRLWVSYRPDSDVPKLLIVCTRAEPGFSTRAAGAGIMVHFVGS
jgi:hypothetical protein